MAQPTTIAQNPTNQSSLTRSNNVWRTDFSFVTEKDKFIYDLFDSAVQNEKANNLERAEVIIRNLVIFKADDENLQGLLCASLTHVLLNQAKFEQASNSSEFVALNTRPPLPAIQFYILYTSALAFYFTDKEQNAVRCAEGALKFAIDDNDSLFIGSSDKLRGIISSINQKRMN